MPKSANIEANSQPTYPPPRTISRCGNRSNCKIVSDVQTLDSEMPARSGMAGAVPVLITILARSNRMGSLRVSTSTVRGAMKRAVPKMKSMPESANIFL